jgi:hypothetical protein
MPVQLTATDAKVSLNAHVASKGAEVRAKYGPAIGWKELGLLLEDRVYVRYPCKIEFNADSLQPGEFAHPVQNGEHPEDGFTLYVHPLFLLDLPSVPLLVLYQLVVVNYGDFASPDDALTFGATALGLSDEDYYAKLCELAEPLAVSTSVGATASGAPAGGCGGGSCSCGSG